METENKREKRDNFTRAKYCSNKPILDKKLKDTRKARYEYDKKLEQQK